MVLDEVNGEDQVAPESEEQETVEGENVPAGKDEQPDFDAIARERGYIPGDNVKARIDELTAKNRELEMRINQQSSNPPAQQAQPKDDVIKSSNGLTEDQVKQYIRFYGDPRSDNYNAEYLQEATIALTEIQGKKAAQNIYEQKDKERQVAESQRQSRQVYETLCQDYPDLRTRGSQLWVEASMIYDSNPWMKLNPSGMRYAVKDAAEKLGVVPVKLTDTLQKEKKKLQKAQDKTAFLGAGKKTGEVSPRSALDKLEAKAIATGDKNDWAALRKAQIEFSKKKGG